MSFFNYNKTIQYFYIMTKNRFYRRDYNINGNVGFWIEITKDEFTRAYDDSIQNQPELF